MQEIIDILFWVGTIAGGLMVLLLLGSIFAGLDAGGDIDFDTSADGDVSLDSQGIGLVKSVLTFISVGVFTARAILLNSSWDWGLVVFASLIGGLLSVLFLSWFFRLLLRNQESGNWQIWQAESQVGTVYIPIPADGKGKIIVPIQGIEREIFATSQQGIAIASQAKVLVLEAKDDFVVVTPC